MTWTMRDEKQLSILPQILGTIEVVTEGPYRAKNDLSSVRSLAGVLLKEGMIIG